jgi:hypothetical protein
MALLRACFTRETGKFSEVRVFGSLAIVPPRVQEYARAPVTVRNPGLNRFPAFSSAVEGPPAPVDRGSGVVLSINCLIDNNGTEAHPMTGTLVGVIMTSKTPDTLA